MILKIGGSSYSCDLISYSPRFDTGIEWRNVGSKFVPLYRSMDRRKWSTDVKVTGTDYQISILRAAIAAKPNDTVSFAICELYEQIFGCEFIYRSDKEHPFYFEKDSVSLSTDTKGNGVYSILSFRMNLTWHSENNYYEIDTLIQSIPEGTVYDDLEINMKSINRIGERDFSSIGGETSELGFSFGAKKLITEVTYLASNYNSGSSVSKLATAKIWFQNAGITPFFIATQQAKNYLFDYGSVSDYVYVLDVSEKAYSNGSNIWGEITVTYGKA